MSNCAGFHSQLTSIMEVLTKAAVSEVCKLVDDGYAVLRLEISRSQKENEELKRKLSLQMLQMGDVRECEKKITVRESALNGCVDGAQSCDKRKETDVLKGPLTIRRRCKSTAANKEDIRLQTSFGRSKFQCADMEDAGAESLIIKVEGIDEDLEHYDPQGGLETSSERVEELEADGGEASPIVDTQIKSAEGKEELPGQHRTRHNVWEDSGLDSVLKREKESDPETQRMQHTGPEQAAEELNSPGYDYVMYKRAGRQETFFTPEGIETETEEAACSYATDTDLDILPVHPELLLAPFAEKGAGNSPSSLGSLDEKPEVIIMDSIIPEAEFHSAWNQGTVPGSVHRYYSEDGRDEMQHGDLRTACLSQTKRSERDGNARSQFDAPGTSGYSTCEENLSASKKSYLATKVDAREKRFICTYCGKSFTCLKNLETHQRVHTGERPFSCAQCGKRFSQSAHLKKHHSVHTGEKPFSCTKCGKCFADSSNLKRHQNVHTGERPFRCVQCGKRFSLIGNLKRHQSVHLGKKPHGGSMWDKIVF